MTAQITTAISQSNFERVRDQIGALLKVEIDNQALLLGTPAVPSPPTPAIPNPDIECSIYVERNKPVDRSEGNVINVLTIQMGYENTTPISQRNTAQFAIDVYTNAPEENNGQLCEPAKYKLSRLIGIIWNILQHPTYVRLQFTNKQIVESRSVTQVLFSDKDTMHEGINQVMARVILTVKIHEETGQIQPDAATSYETTVKLENTEKGYKFISTNT